MEPPGTLWLPCAADGRSSGGVQGLEIRTGNTETSDAVRWAFEDWYIGICRDEMKKTATRAKATDSYMEYRQKQNKKGASV